VIVAGRFMLDAYVKITIGLAMLPALAATPLAGTGSYAVIEATLHAALARLHEVQLRGPTGQLRQLAGRLVHDVLHALTDAYEDFTAGRDSLAWKPGPFSDLRLEELHLLASRHPSMSRRYGAKTIEKRFEQQLALLFQSLGFIVIQTRTGTRTVDLVCISNDAGNQLTFLVEAKTSAARYALPAKDERALRDYAAEIDRTLTTLPRLRFVLLISHAGTKTLPEKLREFEAKARTPIRFLTAAALSQLRADMPGPAPVEAFTRLVLRGPEVLPDDFARRLTASYRMQQEAHRQFAEALLDANAAVPASE
jgi:hypothetical protein